MAALSAQNAVFIHIVTFNSARWIETCLEAVFSQSIMSEEGKPVVQITDNKSSDDTKSILEKLPSRTRFSIIPNEVNIGFCGGHNQGVKTFLEGNCNFLLILNPDVKLDKQCIEKLRDALIKDQCLGAVCAKLFRADDALEPVVPRILDSAGMVLTTSLRHFDRGSEEIDNFPNSEYVFGGTGACVMFRRSAVEALLLEGIDNDGLKLKVHPELSYKARERAPLFDEAFFAYREDADLSWRMQLLGLRCKFIADAIGYHKRVVLPSNRADLSSELNGYSVRNRFLLQVNNYFFNNSFTSFLSGIMLRNIIVILGVLIKEQSSLKYIFQVTTLLPRAVERREVLKRRMTTIPRII